MKILALFFLISMVVSCEKNNTTPTTADCSQVAQTEAEALNFLKGRWKLTEMHGGRAGKQPVTIAVELYFDGTNVEIVEEGKKTTARYEVYRETGSQMLRLSQPLVSSAYYESYKYFSGYLYVCNSQLKVGMGPVDGTDYVYQKLK